MPPQMIAVPKGLVAVAADKGCLGFGLFLDDGDLSQTSTIDPIRNIVLEEFCSTDLGLLFHEDRQNWLLISRLRVEEGEKAVSNPVMLVVQSLVGLLEIQIREVLADVNGLITHSGSYC